MTNKTTYTSIVTWLKKNGNGWKVLTAVLILILLFMLRRDMVKDFTYEKAMMEIKFRDQENKKLQDLRAELQTANEEKSEAIRVKEIQDSLVQANTFILDRTIKELQSKNYNYEKYKAIDNFGSNELRNYYRNLPKHNDYSR